MVNPPKLGQTSYESYNAEHAAIYERLRSKPEAMFTAFEGMPGVDCKKPEGAIYCFPRIDLPARALGEATASGDVPDVWYCKELLKSTGVCVVPGSGFGMSNGTQDGKIWVRTTFLGDGIDWIGGWEKFQKELYSKYQ
jgi:alanine transaminase